MSVRKLIKFNVNSSVRVKLTDEGRKIHRDRHDNLRKKLPSGVEFNYRPPEEDADGYSKWQLWELMQVFGPHICLGCVNPFDTEIQFIVDSKNIYPAP